VQLELQVQLVLQDPQEQLQQLQRGQLPQVRQVLQPLLPILEHLQPQYLILLSLEEIQEPLAQLEPLVPQEPQQRLRWEPPQQVHQELQQRLQTLAQVQPQYLIFLFQRAQEYNRAEPPVKCWPKLVRQTMTPIG
jgi:hypothetical protein